MLDPRGPGLPVPSGLAAATTGMATVALAPSTPLHAVGVFVAASSAGLAWTPFNNTIHRKVRDRNRPTALSVVSTRTAVGIAQAGLAALATDGVHAARAAIPGSRAQARLCARPACRWID